MPRFYETTLSITNLHNLSISTHVNRSRITFLPDVRIRNLSSFPVILQGPFGYAESLTYVAAVYPFGRGRQTQLLLQPHYFIRHPFGVGYQLCPRLLFNQ